MARRSTTGRATGRRNRTRTKAKLRGLQTRRASTVPVYRDPLADVLSALANAGGRPKVL